MPPKSRKKVENTKEDEPKTAFPEVEREFYILQITDLNQKIARLRKQLHENEIQNEELQKAFKKLDVDRADIIKYLKKILGEKNEENNKLKDIFKDLEETREQEKVEFKETIIRLERNFETMKERLTSENKLLSSKLNTLDEFRALRDDLMQKFETQEQEFKDQEMKYKRIIYDTEKKFIISKDKLKKEMEARLLKLAQDFQDATELRIAASTHRTIRENIAINSELDEVLQNQTQLSKLNDRYKESENAARVAMELAEEERDKAISKSLIQLKVIDQLTMAFKTAKHEKALFERRNYDFQKQQSIVQKLIKDNEDLSLQIRILEQNLHKQMCDQTKSFTGAANIIRENNKLKQILKDAATSVRATLKLDEWSKTDPEKSIIGKQDLLSHLLDILTQYNDMQRAESMDTLASFGKIYEEGDLGFIPKPASKKTGASSTLISPFNLSQAYSEKYSTQSSTTSSSSLRSLRTIPSLKVMPFVSYADINTEESPPSFAKSNPSTTTSASLEELPELLTSKADLQRKLAESNMDLRNAIMKEFAESKMKLKLEKAHKDSRTNSDSDDYDNDSEDDSYTDETDSGSLGRFYTGKEKIERKEREQKEEEIKQDEDDIIDKEYLGEKENEETVDLKEKENDDKQSETVEEIGANISN